MKKNANKTMVAVATAFLIFGAILGAIAAYLFLGLIVGLVGGLAVSGWAVLKTKKDGRKAKVKTHNKRVHRAWVKERNRKYQKLAD